MRVIKLAKNNLEKLDNELQDKVKKRVKQEHARLSYFPNQSLGARYLEVNFSPKCSCCAQKKCPLHITNVRYKKCPLYKGFSMRV